MTTDIPIVHTCTPKYIELTSSIDNKSVNIAIDEISHIEVRDDGTNAVWVNVFNTKAAYLVKEATIEIFRLIEAERKEKTDDTTNKH